MTQASGPTPIRVGGDRGGLQQFACAKCGAKLEYIPGTKVLKCPYCAHENEIPDAVDAEGQAVTVRELDLLAELDRLSHTAEKVEVTDVECGACKAVFLPAPNITATSCPFCGTNLVLTEHQSSLIKPGSVLPFRIAREQATESYRRWVRSRWFAPTKLKTRALLDASLRGIYIPAWTYDARCTTAYTGQRGDAYYVTVGSGKNRRTERRIRWTSVSGMVRDDFDDVLVLATCSLPQDKADNLEPWDLAELQPFNKSYLAGFTAEAYSVSLPDGFERAKQIMADAIRSTIRRDIGGDEQRISSMHTEYAGLTYKHILLPIWLSAYRFREKVYRFLVNARTGEVQGERPYSWIKITLAVIAGLILVGGLALLLSHAK